MLERPRALAADEPERAARRAPRPARRRGARDALERGAVEGELFHRGAVVELVDEPRPRRPSPASSRSSRGKDLIRPAAASFAGETRLPLQAHPRPRGRLPRDREEAPRRRCTSSSPTGSSGCAGERVGEYEEILGYHLEQAYRYRTELGAARRRRSPLRAGRPPRRGRPRANDRGDVRAAANLLGRGRRLLLRPTASNGSSCCCPTATPSARPGECCEGRAITDELYERATALGERRLAARARIGARSDSSTRARTRSPSPTELRRRVRRARRRRSRSHSSTTYRWAIGCCDFRARWTRWAEADRVARARARARERVRRPGHAPARHPVARHGSC